MRKIWCDHYGACLSFWAAQKKSRAADFDCTMCLKYREDRQVEVNEIYCCLKLLAEAFGIFYEYRTNNYQRSRAKEVEVVRMFLDTPAKLEPTFPDVPISDVTPPLAAA